MVMLTNGCPAPNITGRVVGPLGGVDQGWRPLGAERRAPGKLGSRRYRVLDPAPGTYVRA